MRVRMQASELRSVASRRIAIVVSISAILTVPNAARSQEPPSNGLVYNTVEDHALTHRCTQLDRDTIECEFVQTAVRQKLKPTEVEQKLQQARNEFNKNPNLISKTDCDAYATFLAVLEGRQKAPDPRGFEKITARTKADLMQNLTAIAQFCRSPKLENYVNFINLTLAKELKTCLVSSHQWTHKFRRSDHKTWTAFPQPSGPCGIVQLSRFEGELVGSTSLTFWNYIARKAITNPGGTFGLNQSCRMLDEDEYKYEWRKRDPDISCEYIEFSPI